MERSHLTPWCVCVIKRKQNQKKVQLRGLKVRVRLCVMRATLIGSVGHYMPPTLLHPETNLHAI